MAVRRDRRRPYVVGGAVEVDQLQRRESEPELVRNP